MDSKKIVDEENNDQINVKQNLSIETVSITFIESNKVQNENEKSHTDDGKIVDKDLRNKDIAAYLKSEFTGLNINDINVQQQEVKLPKYTEIDMMKYSSKNNKKDSKRISYTKNRSLFRKEPIVVQFLGSEKCSEDKEAMEYEPESGNTTVRGIYLLLLVLHFFTLFLTFLLFVVPRTRAFFVYDGIYLFIAPLILYVALVIFAAFTKYIRNEFSGYLIMVWAVVFLSITLASSSGYREFDSGMFIYSYLILMLTDIVILIIGSIRKTYDYTSKSLYPITIFVAIFFMVLVIYLADTYLFSGPIIFKEWNKDSYDTYFFTAIYTLFLLIMSVAELRFLLAGEWIELAENDYYFGAFLMFVAPIDYPIRMLRKVFGRFDGGEEE